MKTRLWMWWPVSLLIVGLLSVTACDNEWREDASMKGESFVVRCGVEITVSGSGPKTEEVQRKVNEWLRERGGQVSLDEIVHSPLLDGYSFSATFSDVEDCVPKK